MIPLAFFGGFVISLGPNQLGPESTGARINWGNARWARDVGLAEAQRPVVTEVRVSELFNRVPESVSEREQ